MLERTSKVYLRQTIAFRTQADGPRGDLIKLACNDRQL